MCGREDVWSAAMCGIQSTSSKVYEVAHSGLVRRLFPLADVRRLFALRPEHRESTHVDKIGEKLWKHAPSFCATLTEAQVRTYPRPRTTCAHRPLAARTQPPQRTPILHAQCPRRCRMRHTPPRAARRMRDERAAISSLISRRALRRR
jgi:hypothetical protein